MRANSQNGVWNIHNKLFNFFSLWVEWSTQTRQCYNPHTFWTFWFYISTWNEPLFLLRTLSYQLSPMSYPVCLHQRSCLLAKFHPSAGCHILPCSYTVAVFTYAFSSSGSKLSGLTFSSRGIHQSSWMRTSSPTFIGFTDEMWWQAFRYIFRNPACSSLRMHPWRDGAPVGKTIRYPDYGSSRITTSYPLARTGSHTTCAISLGTSVAQSICECLLRKQYSSSEHPQTGGNTFSVPVLQDPGTVRSPGSVCDNSPEFQKSRGTTVIMTASQHPSRPWHPLLLQLSIHPRILLPDVNLFQYLPNFRCPQISPRSTAIGSSLVEIIRDVLKSHHSPTLSSIWLRNPSGIPPVMCTTRIEKPSHFGPTKKVFLPSDISYVIPHPVASEHRWLVKAPRWIHSVPDVSGRRSWRCGCHVRLWNLHDVTDASRL